MWITNRIVVPGSSSDNRYPTKFRAEDAADAWEAEGAIVLGVADGLGSHSRAADAASFALCLAKERTTMTTFPDQLDIGQRLRILKEVFENVHRTFLGALRTRTDAAEWKTTLALVVIIRRELVLYASVGDSILAICADHLPGADPDRPQLVLFPVREADASAATFTMHDDSSTIRYGAVSVANLTGVILSTDGLEGLIYPTCNGAAREFDSMMFNLVQLLGRGELRRSEALLWREDVRTQKGDDIGVSMAAWC